MDLDKSICQSLVMQRLLMFGFVDYGCYNLLAKVALVTTTSLLFEDLGSLGLGIKILT